MLGAPEHSVVYIQAVFLNPFVIPLYRSDVMEVRMVFQPFTDLVGRKSLVSKDSAFCYAVFPYKWLIGSWVHWIAGKDVCAYRLHLLNIIGIQNWNILGSLYPGLAWKLGQFIYDAVVSDKRSVYRNVMVCRNPLKPFPKKLMPFAFISAKLIQKLADMIFWQMCSREEHLQKWWLIV